MSIRKIPTVKIWHVKDPRSCKIAEYLVAKRARYTPPTQNEIALYCDPYRADDKKKYRKFQESITTQIAHQADGGGALIWVRMSGGRFYSGGFFGVGRSIELASYNCNSGAFADSVPEKDTYFFWVEKAGATKFVEVGKRRITCFSGKLWVNTDYEKAEKYFHQTQSLASLRG